MKTLALKPLNQLLSFSKFRSASRFLSTSSALPRAMKQETVEVVKSHLSNCHLLAAIKFNGFSVTHFQQLRQSLPDSARLIVVKNVLVEKAIEGTPWAALKPYMKGRNAWLFVQSEDVAAVIRSYMEFQRERKLEGNEFTGAVFEGNFYALEDFDSLENMPTRDEVCAQILGGLLSPAMGLVGTLQGLFNELQVESSAN